MRKPIPPMMIRSIITTFIRTFAEYPVREGKGFADVCFIPRKIHADKPAVIIELKWDKSTSGAIAQIKNKDYVDALKEYRGNLLLVGVNYDKQTKHHTCMIEKISL